MNAVANIAKPSPVDAFVGEVLPPERRQSLFSGMPSHIKPAVFERNLVNAVMANTNLMKYDPRLVYREVSKAAGLGLLLDPQLGEAYIIEAYNYKTRSVEPLLRVGYRGLVKLARQSGEIEQVYAHEVYSLDHLECDLGVEKRLVHKPILFSDRGVIVGYYAVVKYKGGDYDFEPMSVDEVHAIRDRSDAWKAFKDGKIKSTPWSTDDAEMSKKGLALDTPIPTPSGWTTMGCLEVGHQVFDKDGSIVDVIDVSEVKNIPCFRVTFSCGDQIVCDDEHRWLARAGGSDAFRLPFSVQTVNDLYEAKCAGLSVTVPVQAPLDLPPADLPIDPYLLGYWLGDGTSDRANITCNSDDLPFVIQAVERAGYVVSGSEKDHRGDAYCVKVTEGLHRDLRENNLLGNKHVPAIYLRGSIEQRRQLLAGLMDSDGCIDKSRGQAKFCSTSEILADAVYEFAVSLGETPCRYSNEAKGFGVTTIAHWVEWRPTSPCVTLPRKAANLKPRKLTPYRSISSIERIDSVPTKCIAVTSPSRTYLAGRSMAPTHNTVIRRLVKRVPQSPELADALRLEDQAEGVIEAAVRAVMPNRLPPAPPATRQVAYVETHQQDDGVIHDPETGEIQQDEPARDGPKQEAKPAGRTAPKPTETKGEPVEVTSGNQQGQQDNDEHDSSDRVPDYDGQALLAEFSEALDGFESIDAIDEWLGKTKGKPNRGMVIVEALNPGDQQEAREIYRQAKARIEDHAAAEQQSAQQTGESDQPQGDDDTFPGDRPSTKQAAEKAPDDMNDAELQAYIRAWIEASTDAVVMKKRWFAEAELRDNLDPKVAGELRALWKKRSDELAPKA